MNEDEFIMYDSDNLKIVMQRTQFLRVDHLNITDSIYDVKENVVGVLLN